MKILAGILAIILVSGCSTMGVQPLEVFKTEVQRYEKKYCKSLVAECLLLPDFPLVVAGDRDAGQRKRCARCVAASSRDW